MGLARRQRGMALAIVVWFIAGMSLLVGGLVYQARQDVRMAQLHSAKAQVAAAGDGAIQLYMAGLGQRSKQQQRQRQFFTLGQHRVGVDAVPVSGLIDINSAPPDLLYHLFVATGVAEGAEAEILADNVVKWRKSTSTAKGGGRIDALEELLRIGGFDRRKIEAIADYVMANPASGGNLVLESAPEAVLKIVARKDPGKVAAAKKNRQKKAGGSKSQGVAAFNGELFRIDAIIELGGRQWLRRRWVRYGSSGYTSLPWHYFRTEAPRVTGVVRSKQD
jgi:general secretion pathway protein K